MASLLGLLAAAWLAGMVQAPAPSGGFLARLGDDTVHLERFQWRGNRLEGVIVTRVPATRVIRYSLTLDAHGRPAHYEMATVNGDGAPLTANGTAGSMHFLADSIIRESLRDGRMETQRLGAPHGAFPAPLIPYVGVSYLMYEFAFAESRRRLGTSTDSAIYLLTLHPAQGAPQRNRIWLVGADSAELSYFGVAKSGYKFDAAGRLLRADWTGTTYHYRVARIDAPDVDAIARAWRAADLRGAGMGAFSPRDTVRATLAAATLSIEYSRPARRGRRLWGELVPWDQVWRLGADAATHLHTSAALRLGDAELPAGSYTLWMLPRQSGDAELIVNRQTRIFGTMYNPAHDVARVRLTRAAVAPPVERLTLAVEQDRLWIRWGDTGWSAPLIPR